MSEYDTMFWVGYLLVLSCQAPQAWRMLRSRSITGVSGGMYLALVPGLALLQVAAVGLDQHPAVVWGNAGALILASISAAVYIRRRSRGNKGSPRRATQALGEVESEINLEDR